MVILLLLTFHFVHFNDLFAEPIRLNAIPGLSKSSSSFTPEHLEMCIRDREEVEMAAQAGLRSVSLGTRILRCETAPIAALAAVLYAGGNM